MQGNSEPIPVPPVGGIRLEDAAVFIRQRQDLPINNNGKVRLMSGKTITLLDDQQWPTPAFGFELPIQRDTTILGVIDVQHYCTNAHDRLGRTLQECRDDLFKGYAERIQSMIENIQKLLVTFRGFKRGVFYTRHGMQLPDGGDLVLRRRVRETHARACGHHQRGHLALRGEAAYEIIPEVSPQPGELILDKNTSSAFHSTPIDLLLRNMGAETLVLTGLAADQCLFATALDAADRGFHVIIASDACANLDPGSAEAVQILFGRVWGYVMKTDDIIEWMRTGEKPQRTRLSA